MKAHFFSRKKRLWIGLAAAVVLVAGCIWVWEEVLEDRLIPKRFGVVEEGKVYRSGQISRHLVEKVLRENGIRIIVDLTGVDTESADEQAEIAAARKLGIERTVHPLNGNGTGDIQRYVEALSIISRAREEGQPVLVHCAAGAQRTGAAIGFFRILFDGWSPEEVKEELVAYDWSPRKNQVLLDYMDEHLGELQRRLVERGVLERDREPTIPVPFFVRENKAPGEGSAAGDDG